MIYHLLFPLFHLSSNQRTKSATKRNVEDGKLPSPEFTSDSVNGTKFPRQRT